MRSRGPDHDDVTRKSASVIRCLRSKDHTDSPSIYHYRANRLDPGAGIPRRTIDESRRGPERLRRSRENEMLRGRRALTCAKHPALPTATTAWAHEGDPTPVRSDNVGADESRRNLHRTRHRVANRTRGRFAFGDDPAGTRDKPHTERGRVLSLPLASRRVPAAGYNHGHRERRQGRTPSATQLVPKARIQARSATRESADGLQRITAMFR